MRKLASIKMISDFRPIEGKDRIEQAKVDGWNLIVKKGEFKDGEKCVYIEIDSVLPEREEFEFLRSKNFRIKTMKMSGVLSQGICFPLSILPEKTDGSVYELDEDVTEILGVKQYEATMDKDPVEKPVTKCKWPKFLMRFKWFRKLVLGTKHDFKNFPPFISKTDEVRIQNIPWMLGNKEEWVVTEKIDGQSGTFALVKRKRWLSFLKPKFEYIVCSRNVRLWKKDTSSYWSVSDKYNIENVLKNLIGDKKWVAIQGECIGPNIQGNKYNVSEYDMYVFNLLYPDGRLGSVEARKICVEQGLKFVPILTTNYLLPDTVEKLLEFAHGKSAIGDNMREGLVLRTKDGKHSFKAVDPLFLIKYDE